MWEAERPVGPLRLWGWMMIRTLRPTDIRAFLTLQRTLSPNQALTKTVPAPLTPTLSEFIQRVVMVTPYRKTWMAIRDGVPQGLISAKARRGTDIWDIDQLVVGEPSPAGNGTNVGLDLLAKVCEAAVQDGIQRVFMRVASDSPVMTDARRAGFSHYATESIYMLTHPPKQKEWLPPPMRPRRRADHQPLFHLYSTTVPADVRSIEGMTFLEWRWNDGWGFRPMSWLGRHLRSRHDYVLDDRCGISAWLRISHPHHTMELLCAPSQEYRVNEILRFGALVLADWRPIICPVRSYQAHMGFHLENLGFTLVGEHALLARSLLVRVSHPKLMPVGI